MSALQETYNLAREFLCQLAYADSWKELPHALIDIVIGAETQPKSELYAYADFHTHIDRRHCIAEVIAHAAQRVDILALVRWSPTADKYNLGIDRAREKLEEEGIEHKVIGQDLIRVDQEGKPFYLIGAVETYTRQRQGIITLGDRKQVEDYTLDMDRVVAQAQDGGIFWFFDHPMSVTLDAFPFFRLPTLKELQWRRRWFEKYRPIVEIGNHANTLHMYLSNVVARRVVNEMGLVGIANSDTHFNPKNIGRSRTAFPVEFLDDSSQEAFIESLHLAHRPEYKERLRLDSNYASVYSFGKHLIARIRNG